MLAFSSQHRKQSRNLALCSNCRESSSAALAGTQAQKTLASGPEWSEESSSWHRAGVATRRASLGRKQKFPCGAHAPLPRMTNTFMLAGERDPEEIIKQTKRGVYARNFGGGQVDITSGKFVFSASEAYLIEDGKTTAPLKGASLIGNGPNVLTKVSAIGNDFALDPGIGTCGKAGQGVPVGVGLPTLLVDSITVGGTQT